ncbi:MAG: PAS domain-containing protein [Acaryochloridaceae cyanobacterium RL_2_7]|nr:PAS domain-containing protein [Acaryochloridaceae cyanobacterium RL_2_7]
MEGSSTECVAREACGRKDSRARVLQQTSERQRQQLRAIIDNTTSVVYVKDLDGRLMLINEKFTALFDQSPDDMLGMTDFEYLPPDVAAQTRANDRQVLAQQQPVEFEEEVPDHGALKTYISVKFPLCDAEGRAYALGGISTDITERKQSAIALAQRAEELSELNHQCNGLNLS